MEQGAGYRAVDAADVDPQWGAFRKMRRALGLEAFGVDADVERRPGPYVLVEPAATRVPIAGPDGLTFIAIGATAGRAYRPNAGL